MNLQLEAYIDRGQHKSKTILTMDEHPENDQGQQTRGRRGERMHGSGKTEEEAEETKDRGAYQMK